MKTSILLLFFISVSETAFTQSSERFILTRGVVAGGGTTFSTSSRFQFGSTIAQPLAAAPSSSRFSVQGGFWIVSSFLIFAPVKIGNNFNLSFETEPGQTYIVEYTDSLLNPNWQPLSTQTGDGTVNTVTDSAPGIPARYYRVRQQ